MKHLNEILGKIKSVEKLNNATTKSTELGFSCEWNNENEFEINMRNIWSSLAKKNNFPKKIIKNLILSNYA